MQCLPDVHKFLSRSQSQPPGLHKLVMLAMKTANHTVGGEERGGQDAKRERCDEAESGNTQKLGLSHRVSM